MESWSFVSGGKGFISNGAISSSDTFGKRKMPWWAGDSKAPTSFNNCMLEGQASNNQGLGQLGYQDLVGKELPEGPIRDVLSSRSNGGKIVSPFASTFATFPLEYESTSRLSSSIVDSRSRESSLIDLKLGRFGDLRDVQNSAFSSAVPIVSSSESSVPPKRMRMGVNLHTAYCQVYGCNKDLSLSKEYHRRHKVCEVHSKTAKVVVNEVEQRFCQQCSRFHLLSEFDDGKRSCRKRLAGHNERRRKPQVSFHSGRTGRVVQSYNRPCAGFETGRFHGSAQMATSFICPDILPSSLLHPEKCKAIDWSRPVKAEERPHFNPVSIPTSSGNLQSKLLFPSNNVDKVFPPYQDNGRNNARIFSESINNRLLHDAVALDLGSRTLLQDSSLRDDDFPNFYAASTIQGFSGITESGCALSLLSSQSHNLSNHSFGIPIAHPPIVPGSIAHYNTTQFSGKLVGVNYQNSTTGGLPIKFPSPGSSAEGSHLGPILISDSGEAINFDIGEGSYQGSHFRDDKDHLFCEDGATIDLLQLSSQLQRLECEKQSIQVKQETDAFCCTSIT